MDYTKLYDPEKQGRSMRVAPFMSGSGTNVIKIIENQTDYKVVVIFSDVWNSKATEIGARYDIPVIVRDINSFYEKRGRKKSYFLKNPELDAGTREEFDSGIVKSLQSFNPHVVALAGYMSAVSKPIMDSFLGINVHPADLSIMENGKRKYTGANAVRDAIFGGEKYIYSTTHIVRPQVDAGEILMRSRQLPVEVTDNFEEIKKDKELLDKIVDEHQNRLKEIGDWVIFPQTLQMIAQGRYGTDNLGKVYVDDKYMPYGYRLDEQT